MLYLSQIYAALNESERRRIERQFGVILRHPERSHDTCRSIVGSIRRNFKLNQCSFLSLLLEKGNPIRIDLLSPQQKSLIEQSPMLIVDGIAHLPAEFIEAWKFESTYCLKNTDYSNSSSIIEENRNGLLLFSALHRLKLSERQAYLSWLKRHTDINLIPKMSCQSVTMRLYLLIRQFRQNWALSKEFGTYSILEGTGPWPLQEVFAEYWQNVPLYWYQKEVVPFYQCIQDLEKEIFRKSKKLPSSPNSQNSIEKIKEVYFALRIGKFCVVEEEQGFGKKLKPMLYRTIDFETSSVRADYRQGSAQQDLLF